MAVHHVPGLIARKRDGGKLTPEEIRFLVAGLVDGSVPDYQWSALAMAICFRGMDAEETWAMTVAMRDSGEVLDFGPRDSRPPVVDKHSTGGVGDKTSLVLAPLLAAGGLWVPMVAGRGLGITGGTLDKLESIPGYRTALSTEEMVRCIRGTGAFIAGQSPQFCPADRRLYALRDVTATVPSVPLITASIMGKKLAEGIDRLVLDVKFGTGAFMRGRSEAEVLAGSLREAAAAGGVTVSALLTPMSEPLGRAAGNALEVRESVDCLQGKGPADLEELVLDLAGEVSGISRDVHRSRLRNGEAWAKFLEMVAGQGGDAEAVEKVGRSVHAAPVIAELRSDRSGRVTAFDAGIAGDVILALGAGRRRTDDPIDPAVGLDGIVKTGEEVRAGDVLCRIHARSAADAERAAARLRQAVDVR